MNRTLLALILIVVLLGTGFTFLQKAAQAPNPTGKFQVTASFYPLYFFASEIGGDKASVVNITPPGAEPHDYELTAQDVVAINQSKLLILNGGNLEPWGSKIQENIDPTETSVLVAGENLTTGVLEEDGKKVVDPHIWLSPPLAEQLVSRIEAAFEKGDPENAAYYKANAASLTQKLSTLDAEYAAGLASCAQKNIITSHAAFGYLAQQYHLVQVPIAGLSPDAEPSGQQIASIAQFAKENTIKYIFFESLVSPKLSNTLASEIGAKTLVLSPIEGIAPADIARGDTYFSEMESNLVNLKTALQCQTQ